MPFGKCIAKLQKKCSVQIFSFIFTIKMVASCVFVCIVGICVSILYAIVKKLIAILFFKFGKVAFFLYICRFVETRITHILKYLTMTYTDKEGKNKRYTITSALPYANGPVHIGHLAGVYVPADIYARYLRGIGF